MSEIGQEEDHVSDTNTVVFTSKNEIQPFNQIGLKRLYIGDRTQGDLQFAFSSRGHYFENADLWHYQGQALNSQFRLTVIDDPAGWEPDLYVTNSTPIWLSMQGYVSPYPAFKCPFQVFPSYLSPDNAALPYAAVHVEETRALQAVPSRGRRSEHDQLASDKVKVTLYGATARKAADFYDFVLQYMRDAGKMGLMQTMPVMRDEHFKQVEFRVLAQKKTIDFEICYSQSVVRDIARQMIKGAQIMFSPEPVRITPSPLPPPKAIVRTLALVQE